MNQHKRSVLFSRHLLLLMGGITVLFFLSCDRKISLGDNGLFMARSPREAYLASLTANQLNNTKMVKAWKQAGAAALKDSILLEAPFQESGYFRAEQPEALAYRLELKNGELLQIKLDTRPDSMLLFLDLYQVQDPDSSATLVNLLSTENYETDSLAYEVEANGTYLLRIQPELLASGRYSLQLIVQPVYGAFPVSGKSNRDVWSFFGDPRDGGRRLHKGIDIFARRGTPVVAAVDGIVRRVRDKGLGGKQVWLSDRQRAQSLYYAHLDSQLVTEGQRVRAGDTLGLVGNTGNAKNTRPHLHFSIYRRGEGAIDPHPFIAIQSADPPAINADTSRLGQLARVRRSNTPLMAAPQPRSAQLARLDRHLPLELVAASKYWYRVRNSAGISGYLPVNSLENLDRPISNLTIREPSELLQTPQPEGIPLAALEAEATVAVVGVNGNYRLIRDENGKMGWLPAEKSR
jgi:murein DD-endopeptidase MepM/ murein hydrolase activator NlpD